MRCTNGEVISASPLSEQMLDDDDHHGHGRSIHLVHILHVELNRLYTRVDPVEDTLLNGNDIVTVEFPGEVYTCNTVFLGHIQHLSLLLCYTSHGHNLRFFAGPDHRSLRCSSLQ